MIEKRIRIALLIDKSGSYDRGLIRGIVKYSKIYYPWDFFLEAPSYTASKGKKKLLNKLKLWNPDCVVTRESSLVEELKAWGIPIFITPNKKIIEGAINVIADDTKIGEIGARCFIDKGFKNLAYYGSSQIFWSVNRKESFKKNVLDHGLNYSEFEALLNDEWQNNPSNLKDWLQELPKPVGILACSDEFGIHLIEAAELAGISIPQEVAILGVDNDAFICDLYKPSMSSIDQEPETVGFEIGRNINLLMNNPDITLDLIIGKNFHIIHRHSTDIMAIEDKQIIKALNFINKNAGNGTYSVNEVVACTSLSRRLLEIRFRKMLNRSIHQEISRVRIDFICSQLLDTEFSISEISFTMGISNITSFSNFFKREKGLSLNDFRKQFKKH